VIDPIESAIVAEHDRQERALSEWLAGFPPPTVTRTREEALHCFACGGALTHSCACQRVSLSQDALRSLVYWVQRDAVAIAAAALKAHRPTPTRYKGNIDMSELKPCPFCGSREIEVHPDQHYVMLCIDCGAMGPVVSFSTPKDVKERWNTRAQVSS
jgi:Lar family restriction alleviation protein